MTARRWRDGAALVLTWAVLVGVLALLRTPLHAPTAGRPSTISLQYPLLSLTQAEPGRSREPAPPARRPG
jgi:hypothetical protein